jgi:hypothetical protein
MTDPSQPSARRAVTDTELDKLRLDFCGPVFRPGDDGYTEAITSGRHAEVYSSFLWNARFADFRPALIARPATPADVSARLGLDPAELRRQNPAIIWVSISGFGQTGPWRDRPAYDIIAQALSGVMSLTGVPGAPAMRLGADTDRILGDLGHTQAQIAELRDRRVLSPAVSANNVNQQC